MSPAEVAAIEASLGRKVTVRTVRIDVFAEDCEGARDDGMEE
jgi:hypothetical protein